MHYVLLLLNVESTFEIEIVFIGKIEQLATLELFPLRKLNLESKTRAQVAQMKTHPGRII